jgi:RNA polymerase sigma factor (sigma-70 family)
MATMSIALKIKAKNGVLQKFIDDNGWTQSDFARAVGCHPTVVGKWFNLTAKPGNIDTMNKVSALVNKPPEEIFPDVLRELEAQLSEREWIIYKNINLEYLPLHECLMLPAPEAEDDADQMKQAIEKCINKLTPKEAKIIKDRFGFDSEPKTLDVLGQEFGVSGNRIRQIEFKALQKLKLLANKNALHRFIDL